MSVKVQSKVWEHSQASGNTLMVLLKIADNCDDAGRNAWPSIPTIARYCRCSDATVQRAIRELGVRGWITGLRRQQAKSRNGVGVLQKQEGVIKVQPIIDWTDRMVYDYLKKHDLPYHPLWEQGYVSIGDMHTTRPLTAEMTEEETRFFGLKRECGLHIGENI